MLVLSLVAVWCGEGRAGGEFDHSSYDELLTEYARDGMVDYAALKANSTQLDEYLRRLSAVDPSGFNAWSRKEQMAFYINAYNAITIRGIILHYPIQPGGLLSRARFPNNSIRQIGGFWDTPFVSLLGQEITLNRIEHEILRKQFKDPRVHFALVCASKGCPLLSADAYRGATLDEQLDHSARSFVDNEGKVRLDILKNRLFVSAIFKWYAEDFAGADVSDWSAGYAPNERGVVSFIAEYIDAERRAFIMNRKPRIQYLDYDWSLNEMPHGAR